MAKSPASLPRGKERDKKRADQTDPQRPPGAKEPARSRTPPSKSSPKRPPAAPAKKRLLPIVEPVRKQVPCLTCALCCSYIAVAIDGPINVKAASEILWHLYHRDVSVYRDGDDEWMVQFEARCRHLKDDNSCGIYEQRPHICRTYSEESCEVNSPDEGITFYAPDAFLSYLSTRHKRIYREVMAGYVPGPEHLGRDTRPRPTGPSFESRFHAMRQAGLEQAPGDSEQPPSPSSQRA